MHLFFIFQNEYFFGYKQANRREDDIAIVNAGIQVTFETNSNIIKGMRLAFGGMAPTTVMATKAMKNCIGRYILCVWQQAIMICIGRSVCIIISSMELY
jgi:xanthine dehydrogenase/oxidase